VGTDAQLALTAKLRVEHKLQAVSLGITDPDPIKTADKTDLAAAIKEYLSDTAKAKSKRTLYAYTRTLSNVKPVLDHDHAKYCDLIQKYTLQNYADFEVLEETKDGHQVAIFLINPPDYPLIFQKPGQYPVENNKQKSAFGQGTIFFRHGAKSEHGTSDDLRKFMQVRVREMEDKIMKGMRQVLEAPRGAQIAVVPSVSASQTALGAVPFFLTKNPSDQHVVAIDRGEICKYRQKEVLLMLKERLPFGPNLTSHDIKAINKVYDIPANELYCWQPDYSSKQYSDAFIDWIVGQVTNDVGFLDEVRGKLWNLEHPE
jgi:hypothetical protein